MTRAVAILCLLCSVELFGLPPAGQAEGPPAERTYGTSSEVIYALQAHAFEGGIIPRDTVTFSRYCDIAAPCEFAAPVSLPAGAVVTRMELDACLGLQVSANLLRLPPHQDLCQSVAGLD